MMTKTNKICYVALYPKIPKLSERLIHSHGCKKMNPKVDIDVVWVMTWYDPR